MYSSASTVTVPLSWNSTSVSDINSPAARATSIIVRSTSAASFARSSTTHLRSFVFLRQRNDLTIGRVPCLGRQRCPLYRRCHGVQHVAGTVPQDRERVALARLARLPDRAD